MSVCHLFIPALLKRNLNVELVASMYVLSLFYKTFTNYHFLWSTLVLFLFFHPFLLFIIPTYSQFCAKLIPVNVHSWAHSHLESACPLSAGIVCILPFMLILVYSDIDTSLETQIFWFVFYALVFHFIYPCTGSFYA